VCIFIVYIYTIYKCTVLYYSYLYLPSLVFLLCSALQLSRAFLLMYMFFVSYIVHHLVPCMRFIVDIVMVSDPINPVLLYCIYVSWPFLLLLFLSVISWLPSFHFMELVNLDSSQNPSNQYYPGKKIVIILVI